MEDVSRETYSEFHNIILTKEQHGKIIEYQEVLASWNKKINLVSRKLSTNQLNSHIVDSIFLSQLIENKRSIIADIGSGSGLPGIILAIMGFANCNLIEINNKKVAFLKTVAATLKLDINVIKVNVENIELKADYIVSKAFASLADIVGKSNKMRHKKTQYMLLKSIAQLDEIEDLQKHYNFSWKVHESKYNNQGVVIRLNNITKINTTE